MRASIIVLSTHFCVYERKCFASGYRGYFWMCFASRSIRDSSSPMKEICVFWHGFVLRTMWKFINLNRWFK